MPIYITPINREKRQCRGPSTDTGLTDFDEAIALFEIRPVSRRPALVIADECMLSRLPFCLEDQNDSPET